MFYYGCYQVMVLGHQPATSSNDILAIMAEYESIYLKMGLANFPFPLKPNWKYLLVPIEYSERDGGYNEIEVDVSDSR